MNVCKIVLCIVTLVYSNCPSKTVCARLFTNSTRRLCFLWKFSIVSSFVICSTPLQCHIIFSRTFAAIIFTGLLICYHIILLWFFPSSLCLCRSVILRCTLHLLVCCAFLPTPCACTRKKAYSSIFSVFLCYLSTSSAIYNKKKCVLVFISLFLQVTSFVGCRRQRLDNSGAFILFLCFVIALTYIIGIL